jgi:hypothetical protein
MNMKRTNFYFPIPMLKRLRKASDKRGIPISEIIREAIEGWLSRNGF